MFEPRNAREGQGIARCGLEGSRSGNGGVATCRDLGCRHVHDVSEPPAIGFLYETRLELGAMCDQADAHGVKTTNG